ncbi:hypothetical protein CLV42_106332 [Chitinophaga ginsengisoli]|uniref:Uncharacterized protein n=1 Tax=Chitinophaga ginsengisoli TaxID=363837 RepID=A0A2P8G7Q2_9BACT|nr:hypothetical protein CLV42_106332 [Chitinophaga ginsengisoli]
MEAVQKKVYEAGKMAHKSPKTPYKSRSPLYGKAKIMSHNRINSGDRQLGGEACCL